jgi:glyoxylase-like metal-dependent hydrolase (beta-lactamase superfamily II)
VEGFSIAALHTPGHASDHLCFFVSSHSEEWSVPLLFSGDHVMSGSTVVIAPLDGDMTAYMQSLDRLLALDAGQFAIAPGHGALIEDGPSKLRAYLAHRYEREEMVLHALENGPASAEELVPVIYARLASSLLAPAASSVWAHLRRLGQLGRASTSQMDDPRSRWYLL